MIYKVPPRSLYSSPKSSRWLVILMSVSSSRWEFRKQAVWVMITTLILGNACEGMAGQWTAQRQYGYLAFLSTKCTAPERARHSLSMLCASKFISSSFHLSRGDRSTFAEKSAECGFGRPSSFIHINTTLSTIKMFSPIIVLLLLHLPVLCPSFSSLTISAYYQASSHPS